METILENIGKIHGCYGDSAVLLHYGDDGVTLTIAWGKK